MTGARMTGARMLGDHHLPEYHIRPPRGYLNDPNGPVLLDGLVHLYFQYRSTTDLAAPVVWGHASSADFARWSLHRPAMAPDPYGPDRDGCWSGNTVVTDDGTVRAYYSGMCEGAPLQSALLAESRDRGMSFGPPVQLIDDPADDVVVFRDPYVWREPDGTWSMVLGAGDVREVASLRYYASADGVAWSFAGLLAELPRTTTDEGHDTGAMWECPQVLDVDGVRVVVVGAWSEQTGTLRVHSLLPQGAAGGSGALGMRLVDHGPEFYAASVMRDSDHGPVLWGWIREGRREAWAREAGWAGVISLPRLMALGGDGRLTSRPHPALTTLRTGSRHVGPEGLDDVGAHVELEISAPAEGGAVRVWFGEQALLVTFTAEGRIVVDRSRASSDPRALDEPVVIPEAAGDGGFQVRLFVDGSVFELFTATGQVASFRCYPTTPPPWRVEAFGALVHAHGLDV